MIRLSPEGAKAQAALDRLFADDVERLRRDIAAHEALVARFKERRVRPLCAKCLLPIRPWEGFTLDLNDTGSGSRTVIRWHSACHGADPLAEKLADAEHPRLSETEAGKAYLDALGELWLRTPPEHLRGVIDVRRDARPPFTLRGPHWGLLEVR